MTLVSASQQPDQSGQNLAWSLGTIQGDDCASVSITVSLAERDTVAVGHGRQAYATLDAGAVSPSTPAATLQPGNVSDPSLLASTVDADTNDPYIQEEAAALDYDRADLQLPAHPDRLQLVSGSVRGARGTLWSATRATRSTSPAWAWP